MHGEFAVEGLFWETPSEVVRNEISGQCTLYRGSSGWTAMAVSPSIVSGRVVATIIFSSEIKDSGKTEISHAHNLTY